MFQCSFGSCEKVFSTFSNLNRHKRCDHDFSGRQVTTFDYEAHSAKCLDCRLSFRFISDLRNHNWTEHNIPVQVENLEFADEEQFAIWKNDVQKESKTDFIKSAANKKGVLYYYCSRTARRGKQIEKRGKRLPKLQGNNKLGFSCTCQIKVCRTNDGRFKVAYFKTHYGHETEIERTRLPKNVRVDIAEKLANGLSLARILYAYRDEIGGKAKRSDFLTRKDVNNIRAAYNLRGRRNTEGGTSLETWLEDCSKLTENPVLLYKDSGEEFEDFEKDEFALVIMNRFQKELLQRFGCGFISIDTVRVCSFELTTLVLVDDSGECFPAAFLFSNRNDSGKCARFFRLILDKVGFVKVTVFVSDVDDNCHSVWAGVMGSADRHIYSPWHVDRTWRTNISMICDLERRSEVYKSLKAMQRERNEHTFYVLLYNFVASVADDERTRKFGEYFYNVFYSCVGKWASCFQQHWNPTVVIRLENMQKLVRGVWRESGGDLESGVNAIVTVVREKVLHRFATESKRRVNVQLRGIRSRHGRALRESLGRVTRIGDCAWKVTSSLANYSVVKSEQHDCGRLRCTDCRICCSCYECDCTDFCLRSTICKHVHMVAMKEDGYSNNLKENIEANENACVVTDAGIPNQVLGSVTTANRMITTHSGDGENGAKEISRGKGRGTGSAGKVPSKGKISLSNDGSLDHNYASVR